MIQDTISFAKEKLAHFDGGHDWSHTERVLHLARHIQHTEQKGDLETIELAAILHDIADTKFHDGDEEEGGRMARAFLLEKGLDAQKAEHVEQIINNLSFKKRFDGAGFTSIEMQIVQDADRLDAIGAIGIARAFNYGGFKNRELYDPKVLPVKYESAADYKKSTAPTLNHFFEKLFLIRDLMNTETARAIAEDRHRFMEEFVERFLDEWNSNIGS